MAARNLFKLMAIKDEYEVARLYTDGSFQRQMEAQFSGWKKVSFHLAPPIFGGEDPKTGEARKRVFGPWMMRAFRLLARMRRIRGTAIDPFSRLADRKAELALRDDCMAVIDEITGGLSFDNHAAAIELAAWPDTIRGYGHIRREVMEKAALKRDALLEAFRVGEPVKVVAE